MYREPAEMYQEQINELKDRVSRVERRETRIQVLKWLSKTWDDGWDVFFWICVAISGLLLLIYLFASLGEARANKGINVCRNACTNIAHMPRQRGGWEGHPCICSDGEYVATFQSDGIHYWLDKAPHERR